MRVFIHVTEFDGRTEDETGVEVNSAEAARVEAIADLRQIAGDCLRFARPLQDLYATIVDEAGKVLAVIPWQADIGPTYAGA